MVSIHQQTEWAAGDEEGEDSDEGLKRFGFLGINGPVSSITHRPPAAFSHQPQATHSYRSSSSSPATDTLLCGLTIRLGVLSLPRARALGNSRDRSDAILHPCVGRVAYRGDILLQPTF
jgi:hypothetical protein